jgi:hypothetical protein
MVGDERRVGTVFLCNYWWIKVGVVALIHIEPVDSMFFVDGLAYWSVYRTVGFVFWEVNSYDALFCLFL